MNFENKLMKMQSTKTALKPTLKEIYIFTKNKTLTTQKAKSYIIYSL